MSRSSLTAIDEMIERGIPLPDQFNDETLNAALRPSQLDSGVIQPNTASQLSADSLDIIAKLNAMGHPLPN